MMIDLDSHIFYGLREAIEAYQLNKLNPKQEAVMQYFNGKISMSRLAEILGVQFSDLKSIMDACR